MLLNGDRKYPSDLTEAQWECIQDFIPKARTGGRPRTTDMRSVVNAVFYLNQSGCAWRYLPKEYPPWKTVYDYFVNWKRQGVWRKIHESLAKKTRISAGKAETPSTLIIDSQSVRAAQGESRGWDGFKKVRGRKRHIAVDTLGIFWGLKVHAAPIKDARGASEVLKTYPKDTLLPKRVLGDAAYGKTPFDVWLFYNWGYWPQTSKPARIESNLKPTRWIVERSFAWLNGYRRHSRDYERKTDTSEALLYISQTQLLLKRIRPAPS